MVDDIPTEKILPQYLTRRQSQISIIGMGPSYMNENEPEEEHKLTPTDQGILQILYHNYKEFLPLEMWFSTSALARSLGRTPAYIKERVEILENEYGLVQRADESTHIQIRLSRIGAALMEGKMRISDAKAWHEHEGFNYDDLSLEQTVERAVGNRLIEFERNFTEEMWPQAKEEFRSLHESTMSNNFNTYAKSRKDGRELAANNRRIAFGELTKEISHQFDEDRKFYLTLHEEQSQMVMSRMEEIVTQICTDALEEIKTAIQQP